MEYPAIRLIQYDNGHSGTDNEILGWFDMRKMIFDLLVLKI